MQLLRLLYSGFLIFVVAVMSSCTNSDSKIQDYTSLVNPFIGTGGHGHTFPGAMVPFGMVQISPDTRMENWDGSSGYHYSDKTIMGFSHTHLSGTGAPEFCDVLLMPTIGRVNVMVGDENNSNTGYRSEFSHDNEFASPGFYKVLLDDYNITAELTATTRTGFHRYTFLQSDSANIIIDLKNRDRVIDSGITIINDSEISGFRRSIRWAKDQHVYFYAKFSKPFWLFNTARGKSVVTSDLVSALKNGKILGAGLDVLEFEKSSFESLFKEDDTSSAVEMPETLQALLKMENVILSPHVAGWTVESKEKLAQTIVDKIKVSFKL